MFVFQIKFHETYPWVSDWRYISIGSDYGLVPDGTKP